MKKKKYKMRKIVINLKNFQKKEKEILKLLLKIGKMKD